MQPDQELERISSSLKAPYDLLGITPEEYITQLTQRWESINTLMKCGKVQGDIVSSAVKDTLELIAWVQTKKELNSSIALIRSYLIRARQADDNKSTTKRLNS